MAVDEKANQTIERVETLVRTVADHQTRISANELDINGKEIHPFSKPCQNMYA